MSMRSGFEYYLDPACRRGESIGEDEHAAATEIDPTKEDLMNFARQLSLDQVEGMLDDQEMMKLRAWLRKRGVGVAVYSGDGGERHFITYGNRSARIPNKWPPSFFGTWPIYGFLPAGTAVSERTNEGMSHLGPAGDGTWG
jgi:hypothetical protein